MKGFSQNFEKHKFKVSLIEVSFLWFGFLKQFNSNITFLYPLKASEDACSGYGKATFKANGLTVIYDFEVL